jgi:hypothetical protein
VRFGSSTLALQHSAQIKSDAVAIPNAIPQNELIADELAVTSQKYPLCAGETGKE